METNNGGKNEKNGLSGNTPARGLKSDWKPSRKQGVSFDYDYTEDDLAVGGKKPKPAPAADKPSAEKPSDEMTVKGENGPALLRTGGRRAKEEPPKKPKHETRQHKASEKPEKAARSESKKTPANKKRPRGVEEDGLDTSSIAVARGISHEARRRKQNLHDLLKLGVFLLIVGAVVAAVIFAFRFTTVKSISVTGSEKYSQEQLLSMSRIQTGRNIMFYNEKKLADDMNSIIDIRTVSVKKKLPNTIEIVVSDIVPRAAIESSGGSYAFISEDGYVLSVGEKEPGKLIVIRGMSGEGVSLNTFIDKQSPTIRTAAAVRLLGAIGASRISDKVRAIDLSSSVYVILELDGNYRIVLGSIASAHECIGTAEKAYRKFLPVYPNGGEIQVFPGKTQVDFTPAK